MSLKYCRIRPRTTELAALECMKKKKTYNEYNDIITLSPLYFNGILFIFAGNEDMHKSLDKFEIRPNATNGFHCNRYGYNGKIGVITFS